MKLKHIRATAVILILTILATIMPGCIYPAEAAENYVAVMPKVLHSGSTEGLSLTLLKGDRLIPGDVEVALLKQGKEVFTVKERVNGKGTVNFNVPAIEEGDYEIRVKGLGFEDKVPVKVEKSFLIFLETDKPIYKPGQTVHIRTITLNAELKPVSEPVTIEVLDAKGIKIFRSEAKTDEYGLANTDLPLSEEPNLGVWKITAVTGKGKAQLDVRVEKYVLPKYEVKIDLPKDWFLVNEPIKGKISADYSFGKPVKGELVIKASRYVGKWEEYANITKAIDGEVEFELPAVKYVAGVPAAGGMGNIQLDITVEEKATGYTEKTSRLLTVTQNPLSLQLIPEGVVFKPGLPFSFLIVTQTPDNKPVDAKVQATLTYFDGEFKELNKVEKEIATSNGKAILSIIPPEKAVALVIEAFELTPISSREPARASKTLHASYSPSGNFIHAEQISEGTPRIGDEIRFRVYSTKEAANFYYEVVSRGRVVFSDFTSDNEIAVDTTPLMAPSSKLIVYQILPNSEVAADYVPFKVTAEYPLNITAAFGKEEAKPGEEIDINIETDGQAMVGIAAVDKSVFILAENRMNLQQVFDELERLYMKPQAELHEVSLYPVITTKGSKEIFSDAGVIVLTNNKVPEGKEYKSERQPGPWDRLMQALGGMGMEKVAVPAPTPAPNPPSQDNSSSTGLAEVQRIRQFFPETWLWKQVTTDANGKLTLRETVPDTITTWMLRAVGISKENGLGVAEAQLKAFQPFFASVDLPYSAIRGEEFPVKVAVYNYLDKPQRVTVQIEKQPWFDLLDETKKTVEIAASDIGGVAFNIRPIKIGFNDVKVTVQSTEAADALIKKLIVAPEGIARELVDNLTVSGGKSRTVNTSIPTSIVADSGRAYIALTSSYLTQTIDGLEGLIQMPFGCGEQNMIVFAPDVFITKYLKESGQLKPEIMAKAEKLMLTGYQRELIYQRNDGSFSAFGQNDAEGSLWLTAFVLKSFAQAKDLIYIDDAVMERAKAWIIAHQNKDGSFDAVGFVHHQEMLGGVKGKTALTAYVAVALTEAGEKISSAKAVDYLETQLSGLDDPYAVALTAYALELARSDKAADAYAKLMELAKEDEDGLHWGEADILEPMPLPSPKLGRPEIYPPKPQTSNIEATAYAVLALVEHGDRLNASKAAKWLVSQRNASGGFGSTQDTVVTLQALTEYATGTRADVDLTVRIKGAGLEKELKLNQSNFDVLQLVEVPVNEELEISAAGKGEAIAQVVRRFNVPEAETGEEIIKIDVAYDATEVEVNDIVNVSVKVEFAPPIPMEAGMIVLDVSVPTGFAPVTESITAVANQVKRIKRYDIAGRKVIFYIENMKPGEKIAFDFEVKAMYPVKAKGVSSQAYSYYKPEIKGETLGSSITVR